MAKHYLALVGMAVLAVAGSLQFPQFAMFSAGIAFFVLFLGLWLYADRHLFTEFDTFAEIRNANVAVAVFFGSGIIACALFALVSALSFAPFAAPLAQPAP
jgi:uncharacterized membrane protein YjfL (UPF0719 family)